MSRTKDEGAIAVLVALVVAAVAIPLSVIVLDVGGLYGERRQLQHSADAAAMAVAQTCAEAACDESVAATFAAANNSRGADVLDVCGTLTGLTPCTPFSTADANDSPYDCEPTPAAGAYVQVQVTSAGAQWTPFVSASSTDVGACARAAVGTVGSANGLGMTFSLCEWRAMVGSPESYPTPVRTITFHAPPTNDANNGTCEWNGANFDMPGGFGTIESPANCTTTLTAGAWVEAVDGANITADCDSIIRASKISGEPLLIPIFDNYLFSGAECEAADPDLSGNKCYHIGGFASLVVTGYRLSGSVATAPPPCPPSARCVAGYFDRTLIPVGDVISGPGFGVTVVGLIA